MSDIRKALETMEKEIEAAVEKAKESIPEALEEAGRLEDGGRLNEAQEMYNDVYTLGIFDRRIRGIMDERIEYAKRRSCEISKILHGRMMRRIDSNPLGRLIIGPETVEGVCCADLREAVDAGEAFLHAHPGLRMMVNEAYRRYTRAELESGIAGNEYRYYEASECPFCGRDFTEEIRRAEREYVRDE